MPDLPWYPWCSNLSFIYNQYMMLDNNYFRHIHVRACFCCQFWQVNIKLEFMCMFVRGNDSAHVSTIVSITDRIFVIFVILYSLCNYISIKVSSMFFLSCSYLSSNKITSIKSNTFNNLPHLSIKSNTFNNLPHLQYHLVWSKQKCIHNMSIHVIWNRGFLLKNMPSKLWMCSVAYHFKVNCIVN